VFVRKILRNISNKAQHRSRAPALVVIHKSTRFSAGWVTVFMDNGERFGEEKALELLWRCATSCSMKWIHKAREQPTFVSAFATN
jgi:hypothetical protein